ncbi:Hypothetical_protein [Hexamita inflata]|uniref:Hypothetical_protein n=1 Tax=Hexamita inflata TaxID=28002 RepID=A0AA86PW98_9EUKA|nr:Hypothetical protein HINF_LOCUS35195 [Hexamita inflata]
MLFQAAELYFCNIFAQLCMKPVRIFNSSALSSVLLGSKQFLQSASVVLDFHKFNQHSNYLIQIIQKYLILQLVDKILFYCSLCSDILVSFVLQVHLIDLVRISKSSIKLSSINTYLRLINYLSGDIEIREFDLKSRYFNYFIYASLKTLEILHLFIVNDTRLAGGADNE